MSERPNPIEAAGLPGRPPPGPSAAALTRQGLARFAVGDFRAAEQAFRAVVEVAPHAAMAWSNLALVMIAVGELDQACTALRRSLNSDPNHFTPWMNLAGALLRQGKLSEAEAACAGALAVDPASADAWQIRALARLQGEDFTGAAEAFTRTLDLAGESAALRLNLGAVLLKCGRFEAAAASLAVAVALDPASFIAVEVKRVCDFIVAVAAGDMDAALEVYPPGALDSPAEADRVFKTARLYLDGAGNTPAADRVAAAWAEVRPDNAEATRLRDAALARTSGLQPADEIAGMIAGHIAAAASLQVLDLGCGAGRCGSFLRPYAARLVGIDLSAGLLGQAAARGLYDHLEAGDPLTRLARGRGDWDLLVAAGSQPAKADLAALFDGAAASLRDGGLFALSMPGVDGAEALARGRFEIIDRAQTCLLLRRRA